MKSNAYSIYDRKALVYHLPFFCQTDGVAVRSFSDAVADRTTTFSRHPNDYVLYYVGQFDDTNGQMWPEQPLRHVIDGSALVQALQSEIPFPEGTTTDKPSSPDYEAVERQWNGGRN